MIKVIPGIPLVEALTRPQCINVKLHYHSLISHSPIVVVVVLLIVVVWRFQGQNISKEENFMAHSSPAKFEKSVKITSYTVYYYNLLVALASNSIIQHNHNSMALNNQPKPYV